MRYYELTTILVKMLLFDHRDRSYRYLRIVQVDSNYREFQGKYPFVVQEIKSFLYFIRWWKNLTTHYYYNFTEAKPKFQFMCDQSLGVTEKTRDLINVVDIQFNPELPWE